MDYRYDLLCDWYVHPETGVTITRQDMPNELVPEEG